MLVWAGLGWAGLGWVDRRCLNEITPCHRGSYRRERSNILVPRDLEVVTSTTWLDIRIYQRVVRTLYFSAVCVYESSTRALSTNFTTSEDAH